MDYSIAVAQALDEDSAMLLRLAGLHDLDALVDLQHVGAVRGLGHIFPQEDYPFPRGQIHATVDR
jgi:hypothetical protein